MISYPQCPGLDASTECSSRRLPLDTPDVQESERSPARRYEKFHPQHYDYDVHSIHATFETLHESTARLMTHSDVRLRRSEPSLRFVQEIASGTVRRSGQFHRSSEYGVEAHQVAHSSLRQHGSTTDGIHVAALSPSPIFLLGGADTLRPD